MDPIKTAQRAIVTFFQVFLATVIGSGLFDYSAPTLRTGALSAIGAALSVVYNALNVWLDKDDSVRR